MFVSKGNLNKIDKGKYHLIAKWLRPEQDIEDEIYFYYMEPPSIRYAMSNRVEMVSYTATIAVYGEHKFLAKDKIYLPEGFELKIASIRNNYKVVNMRIRHLMPETIIEQVLTL